MIRFPCPCGFIFQVQDEMAGNLIQCPKCARLNDVPTLSDVGNISDDGTIKFKPEPTISRAEHQRRLADLERAYMRYDATGEQMDHRAEPERLLNAGIEEIPLADHTPHRKPKPKYDPITGERIKPLEMVQPPAPPPQENVPVATPVAALYATDAVRGPGLGQVLLNLFMPQNAFVMLCVFMVHLLLQVVMLMSGTLFFFAIPAFLLIVFALVAHYGTVIDETGPSACDELPRPLRQLDWHDDLWGPFSRVMLPLMWCYILPVFAFKLNMPLAGQLIVAGLGIMIGTFLFPALLLISTTSGALANMSLGRTWGTLSKCGGGYIVALGLWIVAAGAYAIGVLGTMVTLIMSFGTDWPTWMTIAFSSAITYPLLLVGIYTMHAFCWYLGLLYRRHHEEFPWVFQRHEYRNSAAAPPPRQKRGGFATLPPMDPEERRRRLQATQSTSASTAPVAPRPVMPVDQSKQRRRAL